MAKPPPSGPEGDSGPDADPKPNATNDPDKLAASQKGNAKPTTKDGAERAAADGIASVGGATGQT